jgi:HK97 gp10 family phage protein
MARRSRRGGRRSRSPVHVNIEGIDSLRERLTELAPKLIQASRAAVQASAEVVRDDTKAGVRVRTGNLRDKVDIHYARGGLSAKVGWKNRSEWYSTLHELGTRRIPAQPALGPALEQERARFNARLRIEIQRILQ